jgi:glycosyltransferase involved in cell wall biosynthesis
VVAARFLPDLGGIENHIYEITRRIVKRDDIQITVLTTDRSGNLPVREEFDGFTVVRCRSYPRKRDYYFSPHIYKYILNAHYDLIHCQGIHTAVPIFAMVAARQRQIPYVVSLHTGGHSSKSRNKLRNIQWRMVAPLLRGAVLIIAVSRFERDVFRKACDLDSSCFTIIQNGGDLPVDTRKSQSIPGLIVASGRLERYKGHQRIIEALPIVQRSIPSAALHILGSGPYEGDLHALVRHVGMEGSVTIEFIPPEDRRRMGEALGKAAVFASLSEYEANPVAVMEALALGIPTVGLDTAGIGDLVADGLVRGIPMDASAATVAEALVAAMIKRPPTTMGSRTLPSWDTAASDLVDVYLNAAEADLGRTVGLSRS